MILYRITRFAYADLSGSGARQFGGRWNSEGKSMVYLASSRSLATLEALAHVVATNIPDDFCIMTIETPDNFIALNDKTLPQNWDDFPEGARSLKKLGDQFLSDKKYLLLKVPSAIVKEEYNYLMNPLHPDATSVKIIGTQPFYFDQRLINH